MSLIAFSKTIRCKRGLPVASLLFLGLLATPAKAASLALEGLLFTEVSGDFTITGGTRTEDSLRIFQDVTGPNIDLFTSIGGLASTNFIGFRLESVVTNRTNTPWVFFDHELQEQRGVPSPEEDGLSFAQGIPSVRPVSDVFSVVDEVTDVRDFVNFTDGVVNPNETVLFRYFVLDNAPNDLFFLRQRPNFAPGGVGTVTPPPATPPATSEPPAASPPPVTLPDPAPISISEPATPPPMVAVPEPGLLMGLLAIVGLGWRHNKQQRHRQPSAGVD